MGMAMAMGKGMEGLGCEGDSVGLGTRQRAARFHCIGRRFR